MCALTGKMLSDNVDHNFGGGQVVPAALAPYVVRGKVPGQEDVINVGMTLGDGLDDLKKRISLTTRILNIILVQESIGVNPVNLLHTSSIVQGGKSQL